MAKLDFSDILNKQVGSAPQPKPIPEGTYHGEIVGLPAQRVVSTKEGDKPILTITIALNEAGDDVDEEALAEGGGLLSAGGEAKRVRMDFWLTEDSLWRYDQFLASLGIEGKTYLEAAEELPGRSVTTFIKLNEYEKNGQTRSINNVDRCFARES